MVSRLRAVDPKQAEPSKPKIVIYGKPGVGKTWTALDFPSVYYIDTEGGANLPHYTDKLKESGGVYFGPEHGSLDFDCVIEQVQALATEKHSFKTLVIDSITEIFNLEIAKEAELLGEKDAFGASKKPAIAHMRRLISWLKRINMNVIIVAHEKTEWKNGKQVGETFDAWEKLEYQLHLCLNIMKLGNKRIAKVRKTRLQGFEDASTLPWTYKEFAQRYGKDVIEKQGESLVLATEEQINEFNTLDKLFNLLPEQKNKWLKAADVEKFEEMDFNKMQSIIEHVKAKYSPST